MTAYRAFSTYIPVSLMRTYLGDSFILTKGRRRSRLTYMVLIRRLLLHTAEYPPR